MTELLDPEIAEEPPLPMHETGLVFGRPVEDRAFEVVEAGIGLAVGVAIGGATAGPVGAAVGAAIGALSGLVAGEAVERSAGRAARTTDASRD